MNNKEQDKRKWWAIYRIETLQRKYWTNPTFKIYWDKVLKGKTPRELYPTPESYLGITLKQNEF